MDELILEKYFNEKKTQIEIAKELNVSKYKVSRVVSKDVRYPKEKENRKIQNKKKNIEFTKNYMTLKRKQKRSDIEYALLRQAHEQASRELSGESRPISNRAFRDWNTSIYRYNEKNKSYVLKKGINVGADVQNELSGVIKNVSSTYSFNGEIMNIIINKNGEKHIQNLAFIKAILIQEYIEHIDTNLEEKEAIKKEVLEFLQKT